MIGPSDGALFNLARAALVSGDANKILVYSSPVSQPDSFASAEDLDAFSEEFGDLKGRSIFRMRVETVHRFNLDIARVTTETSFNDRTGANLYLTSPSAQEAEFTFEQGRESADNADILSALIWKHCGSHIATPAGGYTEFAGVMAQHVQSLAQQALDVTSMLQKAQGENERLLAERRAVMDAEIAKARLEMEEQHKNRLTALDDQQAELDRRAKELDDRRARHARRDLRQTISSDVKARLGKPAASLTARGHRLAVTAICLLGIAIFGGLAVFAGFQMVTIDGSTPLQVLAIDAARFFGSTGVVAVLLFYLLGYWRKIATEDARYEQELERFALDIDRASWSIETVMEFREDESRAGVPDAWLAGATANLFGRRLEANESEATPVDALISLLKTGARFKVGTDGAEAELNPSASKRAAKKSEQ